MSRDRKNINLPENENLDWSQYRLLIIHQLEELENDNDEILKSLKEIKQNHDSLYDDVKEIKIKAGIYGTIAAAVITILIEIGLSYFR